MGSSQWNNLAGTDVERRSMIGRILLVLEAFQFAESYLTAADLVRRTGLPKATVSRLVNDLIEVGLLERRGRQLSLGLKLFELGVRATRRRELRSVAWPYMVDLRRSTGQTIHLAVLDGAEVVYIEILRAHQAPDFPSRVGGRMPAHATAVGKALLAASPGSLVDQLIDQGLPSVGPRVITDGDALRNELYKVEQQGFATEWEESAHGVACVATVIHDPTGMPVAAVSIAGHSDSVKMPDDAKAVMTAGLAIERALRPLESYRFPAIP